MDFISDPQAFSGSLGHRIPFGHCAIKQGGGVHTLFSEMMLSYLLPHCRGSYRGLSPGTVAAQLERLSGGHTPTTRAPSALGVPFFASTFLVSITMQHFIMCCSSWQAGPTIVPRKCETECSTVMYHGCCSHFLVLQSVLRQFDTPPDASSRLSAPSPMTPAFVGFPKLVFCHAPKTGPRFRGGNRCRVLPWEPEWLGAPDCIAFKGSFVAFFFAGRR